jgi:hypothetical protein
LAYARHVIKRTDTHDVERALAMVKAAKDRLMDAADARSQHDVREATSGVEVDIIFIMRVTLNWS